MNHNVAIVRKLCAYLWHTDPTQIIRDVYGEASVDYAGEKMVMLDSTLRFIGNLDDEHLSRLMRAAGIRATEEATR